MLHIIIVENGEAIFNMEEKDL